MKSGLKLFFLVYVLSISTSLSAAAAAAASPLGLALSCGLKEGGNDAENRRWESDEKYLHDGNSSISSTAHTQDASLPSPVPYMTARIFKTEASYKFDIDPTSRYILRLHFYASDYPNYDIPNSYLDAVVAPGPITLLKNFSASITTQALSQAYLIREYTFAPFASDSLTLTFKPTNSSSFAFVNGIELIPEPPGLFDDQAVFVGSADRGTLDGPSLNMQSMFRLNVGGQYIPATNDSSGLMRSWYDDIPYVYGAGTITSKANFTIDYHGLPEATAPLDVYRTSRSQGGYSKVNIKTNVSWAFQVDSNFIYLVRLHFCDLEMDKPNQRVFNVFLNEQKGSEVDVVAWTGAKGVPMRRDYVVYFDDRVSKSNEDDHDHLLKVTLRAASETTPQYFDILLNGLEVFKVSDSKSNLAGPNPAMSKMMQKQLIANKAADTSNSSRSIITAVVGGAAGGAAAFGVAAAVFLVACKRKRRAAGSSDNTGLSSWLPLYGNSQVGSSSSKSSNGGSNISSEVACNCRRFSLAEIVRATKNFDESHVIGVGGFGKVYKGVVDGDTKVAIKRSNPSSEQGVNEFVTEIEMLSKLRHRHLVSLIGFCEEGNEMALVYDYMGKGTLREHLYKGNKITLSWKQRLELLIGAAKGLHYLHTGAKYTIIHRDVKTTNILCDDNWVAKVSDFGLSKTGPTMNQTHVSTVVKGSFGYLDPEYFRRQQLTEKSDVYSFGVVLFEVLCARPALNPSLPKEQVSLADYALRSTKDGKNLEEIVDPQLKGKICAEGLNKFVECARKCLSDNGTERPSMGDVLWTLESILQLETSPDGAKKTKPESSDHPKMVDDSIAMHLMTLNLESDDEDDTNDIFSQIVKPEGR